MPEKWSFSPFGAYAGPTFRLVNHRKIQKVKKLRLEMLPS